MKTQIINETVVTDNFSSTYPVINKFFVENATFQESRNGATKELLDFKTKITNPYRRCVGNNGRNINIFFLLAEAMWIFAGKKDLATLEIFNSQMREYSDDGNSFHAPYGFRIRHSGVSSFDNKIIAKNEENAHGVEQILAGQDQMLIGLKELSENADSRQVVFQIWDSNLDLGTKTKDKPCNDLLMFKIRNGKLITTIANRSNDLHWGLPTNVFQFSFVSEIMSLILGIELGTQTHNSQSLHFYIDNPIALEMYENLQLSNVYTDLYDISSERKIRLGFSGNSVEEKLKEVTNLFGFILDSFVTGIPLQGSMYYMMCSFSPEIALYHNLCHIYIDYKKKPKTDLVRVSKIEEIKKLHIDGTMPLDVNVLAQNFFLHRIKRESLSKELESRLEDSLFTKVLL